MSEKERENAGPREYSLRCPPMISRIAVCLLSVLLIFSMWSYSTLVLNTVLPKDVLSMQYILEQETTVVERGNVCISAMGF